MHHVVESGNGPLTDLLIRDGADIEATTHKGVPVLRRARGEARKRLKEELAKRKLAAVDSVLSICPNFPPQLIRNNPKSISRMMHFVVC